MARDRGGAFLHLNARPSTANHVVLQITPPLIAAHPANRSVLSPGPFVFSIGRRRDPAAACSRLDGGPPSASPLSAAAVPCAPGCDSRPAQPDGRRAGAPGPALRRAPEDHGPRQGAGLRKVPRRGCSSCASTRPSASPTPATCGRESRRTRWSEL